MNGSVTPKAPTDKRSVAEASSCGSTERATGQPATRINRACPGKEPGQRRREPPGRPRFLQSLDGPKITETRVASLQLHFGRVAAGTGERFTGTWLRSARIENCSATTLAVPASSSAAPAAMSTVTAPEAAGVIHRAVARAVPWKADGLPFPTTKSASSKPVTGAEKVTEIENGPVTGATTSLLITTGGEVLSTSTQLNSAPPPASSASSSSRSARSTLHPYSSKSDTTVASEPTATRPT